MSLQTLSLDAGNTLIKEIFNISLLEDIELLFCNDEKKKLHRSLRHTSNFYSSPKQGFERRKQGFERAKVPL